MKRIPVQIPLALAQLILHLLVRLEAERSSPDPTCEALRLAIDRANPSPVYSRYVRKKPKPRRRPTAPARR